MFDEIDEILKEQLNKISSLINSDTTKRWYWTTLQAECLFLTTSVIEKLLKFDEPAKAMQIFLDRLGYGMQLVDRRFGGWSLRQVGIARYGGPISNPDNIQPQPPADISEGEWVDTTDGPHFVEKPEKPSVDDLVKAFRDTLEYPGAVDDGDSI